MRPTMHPIFTIKMIAARAGVYWSGALFGIKNQPFLRLFSCSGLLLSLAVLVGLPSQAIAGLAVQHWTQPLGTRIYLVESPSLPMVDVQIDFDAGGRRDPPNQAGLARNMAFMMDKGTRKNEAIVPAAKPADGVNTPTASGVELAMDENALTEAWADLGAQFNASAGSDRLSITFRSLSQPAVLAAAAALGARVLAYPAYPARVWEREVQRSGSFLRESLTRPAVVAGRAFNQALYGSHPYGFELTEASLARISPDDLRAAHAASVVACRARISIVGAVNREQANALAMALLARLPQTDCAALPPLPAIDDVRPLTAANEQRLVFNAAQAQVLTGQPGYARRSPDHFALLLGNHILGSGGFTSRLFTEVRQKRGLVYGVGSSFSPGLHAGAFSISLQTRPDQADTALALVREVLTDFVQNGPLEAELQAAKDNLVGGFALSLDSNRKMLGSLAGIAWYDWPLDYLDTWPQQIAKVSTADIKAAFGRTLQPASMATVVLGGAAKSP